MMRQQAVGVCVCAALCARCSALGPSPAGVARAAPRVGIIVVDHGSKRAEANDALNEVVARYRAHAAGGPPPVAVEPAHMELAPPTIADAFARCVESGAEEVVCAPFFLSMGRHMKEDIPALMSEAAAAFPAVRWSIAAPLGAQPSMPALMHEAILASRGEDAASSTPAASSEALEPPPPAPPLWPSWQQQKTAGDSGVSKRVWYADEDQRLNELVRRMGTGSWTAIALQLGGGRNSKQCRERYENWLWKGPGQGPEH